MPTVQLTRSVKGLILLLVIIAIVSYVATTTYRSHKIAADKRQAVFLTNGQVYFGHISDIDKSIVTLTDVYYIQQDQNNLQSGVKVNQDISLIKLGGELQGPEDKMFINRNHVLFYENMQDGSKVNTAIKKYVENQTSLNK